MSQNGPAALGSPAPLPSSRRLEGAIFILITLILEILPVSAFLRVVSGTAAAPGDTPPVSVLVLLLIALAGWVAGWVYERALRAVGVAAGIFTFLLAYAFTLATSPAFTFQASGSGIAHAAVQRDGQVLAAITLAMLVLYVWWRGLMIGTVLPGPYSTMQRFRASFGVLVLAILLGAVVLPTSERTVAMGALGFLLPADVLAGLIAMSIARLAERRAQSRSASGFAEVEGPWLRTSLLLSLVIVGFALVLSLVLNYDSAVALLRALGPAGNVVANIMTGVASVATSALLAVASHIHLPTLTPHPRTLPPTTLQASNCHPGPGNDCTQSSPVLLQFIQVLVIIIVIAIFALILRWALLRQGSHALEEEEGVIEERESLGTSGLLGSQVRSFLRRMLPHREPAPRDALAAGSVRYLYREVLRAADAGQHGRLPTETPDEFALRISQEYTLVSPSQPASDLDAISAAYDAARYADREPPNQTRESLALSVRRLTRRLRSQPDARG